MKPLSPYIYGKKTLDQTDPNKKIYMCYYAFKLEHGEQYIVSRDVDHATIDPTETLVKFTLADRVTGNEVNKFSPEGRLVFHESILNGATKVVFAIDDGSGGSTGGNSTAHYGDFD